jgi:hypothetical protein
LVGLLGVADLALGTVARLTMQMPWAKLPCRHRRSKGEYLDSVEAPDRERAEAVAIKQFDLDQNQRGRLLILQRP